MGMLFFKTLMKQGARKDTVKSENIKILATEFEQASTPFKDNLAQFIEMSDFPAHGSISENILFKEHPLGSRWCTKKCGKRGGICRIPLK